MGADAYFGERVAGMRLEHRWGGGDREPFTGLGPARFPVHRKP
ncbi:MAG: hypothetical protein QOK21_2483 [Solirubrobacteraceae bacterium]|nr:hypothetical protein [Solirubrobacteraceae bacterium]